jgi:sugar phosphate permease
LGSELICYIEFNAYNAALFNIQARSLNNLVYWIAQIIGSILIGFLLDYKSIKRRARAFLGWTVLFVLVIAIYIWAYFYQKFVYSSLLFSGLAQLIHFRI